MSEKKINLAEGLSFIFALVLIHFFFFGFICNLGITGDLKKPGDRLLFVYLNFIYTGGMNLAGLSPPLDWFEGISLIPGWLSIFILFFIGVFQAYREDFLVYAIKNNMIMVLFVVLMSWMWYAINYRMFFFMVIINYFTSFHGYLNFIILEILYVGAGFFGGWLKIYRNKGKITVVD